LPPKPPPAAVIVENTEFAPLVALAPSGTDPPPVPPAAPPAPTVIGKAVAVTVTLLGDEGYPSNGLAV
jgi:hypothetical protein